MSPKARSGAGSGKATVAKNSEATVAVTKPVRRSTRTSTAAAAPPPMDIEQSAPDEDAGRKEEGKARHENSREAAQSSLTAKSLTQSPAAQPISDSSAKKSSPLQATGGSGIKATQAGATTPKDAKPSSTEEDDATPTPAPAPSPAETPGTAVKQRMRALENKILVENLNSSNTKKPKPFSLPGQHGGNARTGVSSVVQRFEMLSPSSSPQRGTGASANGTIAGGGGNSGSQCGGKSNLTSAIQKKGVAQNASSSLKESKKGSAVGKRRSEDDSMQQRGSKRRNVAGNAGIKPAECSTNAGTATNVANAGRTTAVADEGASGVILSNDGQMDVVPVGAACSNETRAGADTADDADDESAPTPAKDVDQYMSRKKDVLGVTRQLNRRLPSRKGTYSKGSKSTITAADGAASTTNTPKSNWLKASLGENAGEAALLKRRVSPRLVRMEQSSRVSSAVASIETAKPKESAAQSETFDSKQAPVRRPGAASKPNIALGAKTQAPSRKLVEKKRAAVMVPALEKARQQRAAQAEKDAQKAAEVVERKRHAAESQRRREMRVKERVAQEEVLRQKRDEEEKKRAQRIRDDKKRREREALEAKQRNMARAIENEKKRKEKESQEKRNRAMKREAEIERKRAEKEELERNRKQLIQAELRRKRDDLREKQTRQEQTKREREKKELRRKQLEAQIEQARKQKEAEKAAAAASAARRKAPPPPTQHVNYDISDLQSDCSTDEEDDPRQRVPIWAQGKDLKMALYNQHILRPRDGSDIFDDVPAPDLDDIFPVQDKARRIRPRTSSALWSPSPTRGLHKKM